MKTEKDLAEIALHDFHEDEPIPAIDELDDEDIVTLLEDSYLLLGEILILKRNPKWLDARAASLLDRLDKAISWVRLH